MTLIANKSIFVKNLSGLLLVWSSLVVKRKIIMRIITNAYIVDKVKLKDKSQLRVEKYAIRQHIVAKPKIVDPKIDNKNFLGITRLTCLEAIKIPSKKVYIFG